jgi:nucleotide-binding universal stress UspA family protein
MIIGTSLTAASDEVVRTGIAIARATGAAPWLVHGYMPPALPSQLEGHLQGLHEALAQQAERTGLDRLPGFKVNQLVPLMDSPSRAIVELARQTRAELIVVGAAEGSALHHLVMGSTAAGVLTKAPCSVLVLRSPVAWLQPETAQASADPEGPRPPR